MLRPTPLRRHQQRFHGADSNTCIEVLELALILPPESAGPRLELLDAAQPHPCQTRLR